MLSERDSHSGLSSPDHTRFRLSPRRKYTIHLQTSMPFPGFEPRPYGKAVSVTNHSTGWAAHPKVKQTSLVVLLLLSLGDLCLVQWDSWHASLRVSDVVGSW
ncbi:hypothetical protein TNCV_2949111 [Trichonephila clavipes]|nr:hypothetical protein TNCV_2949111 [Trichonephila clavipes]